MAMTQNEWKKQIEYTIESNDMYGWSFTYGQALKRNLLNGSMVDDDTEYLMAEYIAHTYGADIDKVINRMPQSLMAEVVDISVLDDIARMLAGEDDE